MNTNSREYCKQVIQIILDKAHSNPEKRKIRETMDGLQFACPITGDSTRNINEKRGHLYWDTMFYISYDNDGVKMPFTSLCKHFDITIDIEQKAFIYEQMESNMTLNDVDNDFFYGKLDLSINLNDMMDVLNNSKSNSPLFNIKPVEDIWAKSYLDSRGIFKNSQSNIFQGEYIKGGGYKEKVIVILNRKGDKVLGCQIRNLKDGHRRMFKIYNFEQLNTWIYPDREINEYDMVVYNKISYYFNILNVNFDRVITIFEGYIDSIFFENSIGVVGVGTDMKFLESSGLDLQYFFDNDDAGWKKTEEKIKDGYPCFLWNKLFESIVEKKSGEDPYKLMHRISAIKDLNKLNEVLPGAYKKLDIPTYFSRDQFDLKWVPASKKTYYKKPYVKY